MACVMRELFIAGREKEWEISHKNGKSRGFGNAVAVVINEKWELTKTHFHNRHPYFCHLYLMVLVKY